MAKEYVDVHQISEMLENAQIITDGEINGYCTEDVDLALIRREDVEPVVHAHWNFEDIEVQGLEWITAFCSNCGDGVGDDTPYCPHCGAKMDEEVEE